MSPRPPGSGAARRSLLRACLFAVAFVAAANLHASAQQPELDAGLRLLLQPQIRAEFALWARGPAVRPAGPAPLAATFSLDTDAAGRPRVAMFAELRAPDALERLREAGAEIGTVVDDVAIVRIPVDALDMIGTLPLGRVQAARVLATVHDSSMSAIRVDAVRQRMPNGWSGTTGAGAIVGILDTGIDIRHPDFHDDAGQTRLVGAWDQTFGVNGPPGFNYGFYCSAAAIQQTITTGQTGVCPMRDVNGHGTHVAGTAAGDGAAGEPGRRYAGVAPGASLLVVRGGDGSFTEDRVIDGLAWIRGEAQTLGRPAVVNLSLGHQYGPHDGSTLFERMIDGMVRPGFIVVASAGNQSANANTGSPAAPRLIHARAPATAAAHTVEFEVTPYSPSPNLCTGNAFALSLWYDVRDRVEVTVIRPNGTEVTARAGVAARVESNDPQGRVFIENAFPLAAYPVTAEAYIQADGCSAGSGTPAAGTWRVRLRPEPVSGPPTGEPMDLYLHTVFLGTGGAAYGTSGFDNRYVIGSPGTARRAITVGAFATRHCWPAQTGGEACYLQAEEIGDIARFSSAGPTRDGRLKPEITAPGIGVISALSANAQVPANRTIPGGRYWALEGTSMAAPHVTGVIALMLEHRPLLAPEDVVDLLSTTGRQDDFTLRTYDPTGGQPVDWWGHGKLDALGLLARLTSGAAVAAVRIEPASDTLPQGAVRQLNAAATDAEGGPVLAAIQWQSLDPATATVDFAGRVRALLPGVARIVATAEQRADTARIAVQPPAVLALTGRSVAPPSPVLSEAGTLLPLLSLRLEGRGPENIEFRVLGLRLTGADSDARIVVLDDPTGSGQPDPAADTLADLRFGLTPAQREVAIALDSVVIARNGVRHIVVAVGLSGAAPTGSTFAAELAPDRIRTLNVLSRVENRFEIGAGIAAAGATTILRDGELFVLSENPIRSRSMMITFAERPTLASIHTVTGSRVRDLTGRIQGPSVTWDLTNDRSEPVVPGVYLLVMRIRGQLIRERIMVLAQPPGAP